MIDVQKIPTDSQLVPHLGALRALIRDSMPVEQHARSVVELESLPFYLRGMAIALLELDAWRVLVAEQTAKHFQGARGGPTIVVEEHYQAILALKVDEVIGCGRRAVDGLTRYLGLFPQRQSVPKSMTDLVDRIGKGKVQIEDRLAQTITTYWNTSGLRLKQYRDRTQHTGVVIAEVTIGLTNQGLGMRLLLADDPSVASPNDYTYSDEVSAIRYLYVAFQDLLLMVNHIVERLIDLGSTDPVTARQGKSLSIMFKAFTLGPQTAEAVPYAFDPFLACQNVQGRLLAERSS